MPASDPTKIHFRGTVVEMGGSPDGRPTAGEPTVTVTLDVPLHDARRMAPLLYTPTNFTARAGDQGDRSIDVREGSVVLVESSEFRGVRDYRVRRCQVSGLYMVDQEGAELTLAVKQY